MIYVGISWDGRHTQTWLIRKTAYQSGESEEEKLYVHILVYEFFRYFLKNIVPHLVQMANVKLSGFQYLILSPEYYLIDFLPYFLASFGKGNNVNYCFSAAPFALTHRGGWSGKERLLQVFLRIFVRQRNFLLPFGTCIKRKKMFNRLRIDFYNTNLGLWLVGKMLDFVCLW